LKDNDLPTRYKVIDRKPMGMESGRKRRGGPLWRKKIQKGYVNGERLELSPAGSRIPRGHQWEEEFGCIIHRSFQAKKKNPA
jgi:hypothetical protein